MVKQQSATFKQLIPLQARELSMSTSCYSLNSLQCPYKGLKSDGVAQAPPL